MPFATATVFRTSHASARRRMAPSHTHRYGDRWNAEADGYVPTFGHREAFRSALLFAWHDARSIATSAKIEAELAAVPADVVELVAAMRADAWYEPITTAGNARMVATMAAAAQLIENARGGMSC